MCMPFMLAFHQSKCISAIRAVLKPMQPLRLHWAPCVRGPAPWWLCNLFIFVRYLFRTRIVERLINIIVNK